MDATDDRDLWVQKNSTELLAELLQCIPRFLYRQPRVSRPLRPRQSLSGAALSHVLRLLEMFQEWPQLLDPSLDALISPVNNAFLDALILSRGNYENLHRRQGNKFCIPQALSGILYAFCKVRGSKVIVRFLSNEARYLQPMLDAFEVWTKVMSKSSSEYTHLIWKERYIVLLWISHLLLTPFDLSTVGSDIGAGELGQDEIEGLKLPPELPLISYRLIFTAISNISSPSKERESAILVLVRLGLRPDMRRLNLHDILVRWAISQLQDLRKSKKETGYLFIGLLSFLAAFVKSAETQVVGPVLLHIFTSVEQLGVLQSGSSSAMTRKSVIKIYSACSVAALSLEEQPDARLHYAGQILEPVIDELLSALSDNDTPVRQSASKALSVIATKLESSMAADISEAVISNLDENVLWETVQSTGYLDSISPENKIKQRNLSLVNPSKWQGLVLTLSQLLFRRCPPIDLLPGIVNSLILALSFEQRSSSGASMGANVRDAACFGIWAIARRYTTTELLTTDINLIPAAAQRGGSASVLQLLAIELLVTATTDPAGNIRRGASAALQELIGRHPDTIAHGIPLVQIVDYHAVALRSRAMKQVAIGAADLDEMYWHAVIRELLTWRGIAATDVDSRRLASDTIGILALSHGLQGIRIATTALWQSLDTLDGKSIQKRQGFLLTISALVQSSAKLSGNDITSVKSIVQSYWKLLERDYFLIDDELISHTARPELMNEAVSLLIYELANAVDGPLDSGKPSDSVLENCFRCIDYAIDRREQVVLQNATQAIKSLFRIATDEQRNRWLEQAFIKTNLDEALAVGTPMGYLLALGSLHSSPVLSISIKAKILQQLIDAAMPRANIDIRIVALQALIRTVSDGTVGEALHDAVVIVTTKALQDYTTDQRGDVGSLLRLQAIELLLTAFKQGVLQATSRGCELLETVTILAGEKLDKVRSRAWICLITCWNFDEPTSDGDEYPAYRDHNLSQTAATVPENIDATAFTSPEYFTGLLKLFAYRKLRISVFQGLVGSAGAGSESVLIASRVALVNWMQTGLDSSGLQALGEVFEHLLENTLSDDRVLVPALETLGLLLDTNTFIGNNDNILRWRKIFILVQKAHFKTANIPKLIAAIGVYSGLGMVESLRTDIIKKLLSMMAHPYPRVRNAAADSLFLLTHDKYLKRTDWADSTKFNKQALSMVKESLQVV